MKDRLKTELVALFGRGMVEQARRNQPAIDALMAQAVHRAAGDLLKLSGRPIRQRELAATYPESVRLALINWVLAA